MEKCWSEIPEHYEHIELGTWQVMPNHFHGLARITCAGGNGLGEVMNMFKGAVTREARRAGIAPSGIYHHGEKDPVPGKVWAPNYYDVICFDAEELEIRERYVRANPRHWALRDVPEGFVRKSRFKGNVELLKPGPRRALRVSRRASDTEIAALQKELAKFGGIVCGTFFSPGERACLKSLLAGSARVVWVLPMAMPEQISVAWTNAFLEGRVLWLSAFPDEQKDATRASCEQANQWVERFCKKGEV